MREYIHTVLNGLKAWVTGEVNKLLLKIDAVGVVAAKASNVAAKNKNGIASLNKKMNGVAGDIYEVRSIANTAQRTAETSSTKANTAQSTAETAKAIANGCVKPTGWTLGDTDKKVAYSMLNSRSDKDVYMLLGPTPSAALKIHVGELGNPSVTFEPPAYGSVQANFEFSRAGSVYSHPLITGIGGIVMKSSVKNSTKQFKITVDDTGTLTATEVTTS